MDIRKKFIEQKRQNDEIKPDFESKVHKQPIWQDELLEKMALRVERLISKHSAQWAATAKENPEIAEDLQRIAEKTPPRRISFDDLGGILEMLNEKKE